MLLKNILLGQLAASLATASPLDAYTPEDTPEGFGELAAALGGGSWAIEGYARDNPIGETTGGEGGEETLVSTAEDLVAAATSDGPAIIRIEGDITLGERLNISSDKTLLGVGTTAHIHLNGLNVRDVDNVIIRNIKISHIQDDDCITVWNSTRVWIDHNEFTDDIIKGPDFHDGAVDIVRASDWVTLSWNYFHNHYKTNLIGNDDTFRDIDSGHLHVTLHHNRYENCGTRGPAGRFGHQHVYNNYYEDFHYQAIHSRSDNQMLVEGNVFTGDTREAVSTYGLVIPEDSPNTCICGDEEIDGFVNLGAENDFGGAGVNITQEGNFTEAPYEYKLSPLSYVQPLAKLAAGVGKI